MKQATQSGPAGLPSRKEQKGKARRDLIRIVLIIALLATAIVLTAELETILPAFIFAIAFLVLSARQ